jgi:hypothetical protein
MAGVSCLASSSAAQSTSLLPPSPKENHTSNVDDKGKGDDMGKAKSQGTRKGKVRRNKYKTAIRKFHRSDMLSPTTMVDTFSFLNPETNRRKVEWVLRKGKEPRRIVDAHPWMAATRPVYCSKNATIELPIAERERPRYFSKPLIKKERIYR